MNFENTKVMNFEGALHGMRNPKESWGLSDTQMQVVPDTHECFNPMLAVGQSHYGLIINIGPKDMKLAQNLIHGGSEHRKFLRQILVSVDITAPLYWWKEFDTYKVGTTANSTSTMHKLTSKPITFDSFETDDYNNTTGMYIKNINDILEFCESLRRKYVETNDKRYWKELVRWLPESWLQTRTVTLNYENLFAMYHQRKNHKLNEWSGKDDPTCKNFVAWLRTLPYSKEFIWGIQEEEN